VGETNGEEPRPPRGDAPDGRRAREAGPTEAPAPPALAPPPLCRAPAACELPPSPVALAASYGSERRADASPPHRAGLRAAREPAARGARRGAGGAGAPPPAAEERGPSPGALKLQDRLRAAQALFATMKEAQRR
jgi:hypothetical protein